jgi:adenosylhomocysteine nucleosidase
MPGELKPFLNANAKEGWLHERRGNVKLWRLIWPLDQGEWVAACAGAGAEAATRAFAEAERDGALSLVISTGWAGALSGEFEPGQAYRVSQVVDARTGERFETADLTAREVNGQTHPSRKNNDAARVGHPGVDPVYPSPRSQDRDPSAGSGQALGHPGCWLVTSPRVADQAEKLRLAGAYGAGLVDMEAAAVARLAAMRGIPFACSKGVSDGFAEQLPDFNRFISDTGKFQLLRFVVFVLLRPWHWPALIRMGENSRKAARRIADSLLDILDEEGSIRKRNAYPNR